MVKVNIISGFLGAGKTTLIKKLLGGSIAKEKVILLENEYGEIGIDGSFMKDSGITVTELNSGCICCTLAGDFQKAMDELIDTYHPDRILVEPTGVGKLSEIIAAVEKAKERHGDLTVSGCATVVDAGKCRMYMKNFGEFFLDQVKTAATIIFSRTQLLSPDRVEKSRALILEQHPDARIVTTPWDELAPDFMLEVIESGKPIEIHVHDDDDEDEDDDDHEDAHAHHHEHHHGHEEDHEHHGHDGEEHHHHDHGPDCECGCHDHDHDHEHDHEHHHHHHHHPGEHDADEVFENIGVETARRFTQEEIRAMTDRLSDQEEYGLILRAKGILQTPEGDWFQFDYVPGELQLRPSEADYAGRLVVIGTHIDENALKALFNV
ncbi:MAG: GTP-binding protein [Clostridiales bacterium]|nr:GTP-binding protein [Clostridiales bacterium]